MNANRLRVKLREGKTAIGIMQIIPHPALVEIQGFAGFDFVMLDGEHGSIGPYNTTELENLLRAAEMSGITPIVRVPENNPVMIGKVLDAGAQGVVIPRISNRSEAERGVRSAKYPPRGIRGGCPRVRATKYSFTDFPKYSNYIDKEVFVMLIVEDEKGIENLPEIVQVEGIDAISIGWFDLSVALGLQGDVFNEKVTKAVEAAAKICMQHGVPVCRVARSPEHANELIKQGAKIVQYSTDVSIFGDRCKEIISQIQNK